MGPLKGSCDVAKKNIILCIWCNQCNVFTRFEVQKTHYFPHTVHYAPPFWNASILQSSSFWEARCALIGQLSSALWLDEYLKRVTEMLRPLPCCDAMSRRNETKTIKPTINEAFVAFSENMITDYNYSYGLFTRCAAPCKHNTMSAFVIVETPNKHYSINCSKLAFK